MIDQKQLRKYIVVPVLQDLGMWSRDAEDLVMGTIAVESNGGQYIRQIGGGPALGICQIEMATHNDIAYRYLAARPDLLSKVLKAANVINLSSDHLMSNLKYAVAICRLKYFMIPTKIPGDLAGQAAYWKRYYNTPLGAGTEQKYIRAYHRVVGA